MSDNVVLFDADGNRITFGTNDVGGVHYQKNKVFFGEADVATGVSQANPFPVQLTANANAEGSSPHLNDSVDKTVTSVSANPGILFQLVIDNPDGSDDAYLHVFNDVSVVLGTSTPVLLFRIRPNEKVYWRSTTGTKFGTAIRYAATKQNGPYNDPTTPLIVNAEYK